MPRLEEAILSERFIADVRDLLERSRSALLELDRLDEKPVPAGAAPTGTLDEVDAALARLDDGSFGSCTKCHDAIPAERIEIMPTAALCVQCQYEIETRAF